MEQLSAQDMEARKIWKTIMAQNPDSKCVTKDIHNALQKINATRFQPKTSLMQKLEHLLHEKQFTYYTRQDPSSNVVEDIFFVHPLSYEMWRAFPHVLFIDATYKTNMYNLPFAQIVGMTSTNQTFCVAGAFLSKEREGNFIWVLEMLRTMLDDCMEPRVILTDKDQALINACDKIFPNAHKYLCRFHILQNIVKNCKKSFVTKDEWGRFIGTWKTVCASPTPEIYVYNVNNLYKALVEDQRERK